MSEQDPGLKRIARATGTLYAEADFRTRGFRQAIGKALDTAGYKLNPFGATRDQAETNFTNIAAQSLGDYLEGQRVSKRRIRVWQSQIRYDPYHLYHMDPEPVTGNEYVVIDGNPKTWIVTVSKDKLTLPSEK